VLSEILILPTSQVDSTLDAIFTVSPQTSYANLFLPTTPATTGPECTPILTSNLTLPTSCFSLLNFTKSKIYNAAFATFSACSKLGVGKPPTHIYASPIVFIFSKLYFSQISSNLEK